MKKFLLNIRIYENLLHRACDYNESEIMVKMFLGKLDVNSTTTKRVTIFVLIMKLLYIMHAEMETLRSQNFSLNIRPVLA